MAGEPAWVGSASDVRGLDRPQDKDIGRAHWQTDKSYKHFESCLLPLGADGETVDMIMAAIKFSD
jgi:hypothetical protein